MNEPEVTHLTLLGELKDHRKLLDDMLTRVGRLEGRMTLGASVFGFVAGIVGGLILHLITS